MSGGKISDSAAKAMAEAIKQLLKADRERPREKSSLELLDERIRALNEQIAGLDNNPLLKKQVLMQLRTAMRKRQELAEQGPKK